MRTVHAHFPINCIIPANGSCVDVKNFLGGKQVKHIDMLPGVTVKANPELKDEIIFQGFDNAAVSLCCARVCQSVRVGKKDERKFLDGIFVSNKDVIEKREEEE
jgi:large subunit ribosomal protein L9e